MEANFWTKNKVFLIGLSSAILLGVQQYFENPQDINWKAVVYAVFTVGLTYFARNWRGQSTTIFTTLAGTLATFLQTNQGVEINYWQMFLMLAITALGASSPDPKPVGYEQQPVIQEAKKDGKESAGSTTVI
jgi:hypothetical protein